MVATVNISVTEGREYLVTAPAGITIKYNNEVVTSTFIAVASVNQVLVLSDSPTTGSITVTEIVRGYYEPYDAQGGTWAYQPGLDKWFTQYSFRPEWMTLVGNRLVTFKDGKPYIHTGTYNTFYGQAYDSVLAFPHNEAGNVIKSYQSISIEGDTPDLVHHRTEVPYVQSSDLRYASFDQATQMNGDFRIKEGVSYATILRDRLSPNTSGSYDQKVMTGDKMRGEVGKFQVVYNTPTTKKELKFANVGFIPSLGHTTTPQNQ